jgi:hypothetical protein
MTACTSSPIDVRAAKPVPVANIEPAAVVDTGGALPAGLARLQFVRDFGFDTSTCPYDIFVDDQQLFAIGDSEALTVRVPGGQRRVRLEMGHGFCQLFQTSLTVDAPAGSTTVVRAWLNGGRPALKAEPQK